MVASNREPAIKVTLGYEGGYTNHPSDPGGPTNWGITIHDARKYWKADATAADVKGMPKGIALDIYRRKYWAPLKCDDLPAGVDLVVFDYGVNSGIGRAGPVRDKTRTADAVKWVKAICAERLAFLHRLRTWSVFGKGWGRRVADVEARGVKMALTAVAVPDLKGALEKESKSAAKQATKEAAKAGGTVAAPTGGTQAVDVSNAPTWLLWVVGAVFAVGAAIFIYRWWINRQRAAAYAVVAKES